MHDERANRYDFEGKSNRFMEFISREVMRNKHHQSHAENIKQKNNVHNQYNLEQKFLQI